jgi:hypothetical protein
MLVLSWNSPDGAEGSSEEAMLAGPALLVHARTNAGMALVIQHWNGVLIG